MGILRRWRLWFRRLWRELGQRWYCWRHGVVPVAASVYVWSITIDGEELLACPIPGTAFSGADLVVGTDIPVVEGSEVSIRVENLSSRPVPFQACLSVDDLDRFGSTMYPFPLIQLAPKGQPFPPARSVVRVMQPGRVKRLFVPPYARKP